MPNPLVGVVEPHGPGWPEEAKPPREEDHWAADEVKSTTAQAAVDVQLDALREELASARAVLGVLEAENESAAEEAIVAEGIYTAAATTRDDHARELEEARGRLRGLEQPVFDGAEGLAMQRELTAIDVL